MSQPAVKTNFKHLLDKFDLEAQEFADNFDEVCEEIHQGDHRILRSERYGGYWVVTGFDDIRKITLDWQSWTNTNGYEPMRMGDDNARLYPLEIDPPYQTRWRQGLGKYFAPNVIQARQESIRHFVNGLIDNMIEGGECDFVEAFAAGLPGRVFFSTMLGVPLADLPYLQGAADQAVRGPMEGRMEGWNKVGAYLNDYMLDRQKQRPRGDFTDAILEGVELENGEPAPWLHKVFVMVDMVAGGLATTTFLLSGLAHFLGTHPDERDRLADNPDLRANTVEELIRYYASILALGRTATHDAVVCDQEIKEGEMIMLAYAVAARDPQEFPEPSRIDIERQIGTQIAFGYGPHRCIGNQLARLNTIVAMDEILRRMPDLQVPAGAGPKWFHSTVTRDILSLPVVFTPGRKEQG
jgi:cytochrome P450